MSTMKDENVLEIDDMCIMCILKNIELCTITNG